MIAPRESAALKARWEAQKAKLRARFPKLTDADLDFEEVSKVEMLRQLEIKLALTIREIKDIMDIPFRL